MNEQRTSKRNIACFLADAVGWPLGQSFLSPETILPMFVARLSGSNIFIGLMVAVQSIGNLLPQLVAANIVERLPITKRYVVILGIIGERLPIVAVAAVAFFVGSPKVVLFVFFLCWAVMNASTGFNMPAFLSLFAKSTTTQARGRITGVGNAGGTLLAVVGAYAARMLLESLPGLQAYGWCFIVGFIVLLVTVVPLGVVDEPREEPSETHRSLGRYLRELPSLLRRERRFRTYVYSQVLLQIGFVSTSFVTGYVVLGLGESEGTVALCTAAFMGANAFGSLIFGFLGDSRGYRIVFVVGAVFGVLGYGLLIPGPEMEVVFVVFGLLGLFRSSMAVGSNMSIEFSHPRRAATYTAVVFTATAPLKILYPLIAGLLADSAGFPLVFGLAAGTVALVCGILMFRFSDPRFARSEADPNAVEYTSERESGML